MARIDGYRRTDVIQERTGRRSRVARQALTGSSVVARKPTGEEVAIETPELAVLEGKGNRLSADELGLLAKGPAAATNPVEAARLKERLTRGFYGI